ncbi:MAG: hypothetical protein ACRYFU_06305 [Janthinobacterium lividum]
MTSLPSAQRVNVVCAWAGALIALAYDFQQNTFPRIFAAHSASFLAVMVAITATLVCLHLLKQQRWMITALCFLLGALFTTFSVCLVAWSSSLC